MKKLITALLTGALLVGALATTAPKADAQVVYCGSCCDRDPYGYPRVRCILVQPFPCGGTCECAGIVGYGFSC